jgi:hypothetical protein
MERHEVASDACEAAGLQILELAQTAYSSCCEKPARTGASRKNACIELDIRSRKSSPTYIKPFDVLANGGKTGEWLLGLGSEPLAPSEARRRASRADQPEGHEWKRSWNEWLAALDDFRNWLIEEAA